MNGELRSRERSPIRRIAVGLGLLTVAAATATGCLRPPVPLPGPPPGPQPSRVAVYGDSLLNSSTSRWRWEILASLPGWGTLERTEWGTAPCDHRDQMEADARLGWKVRVAVIAFYGNQATPCTAGRDVETLYRADLSWAVEFWSSRGVPVVLVVPPGPVGDEPLSAGARAALAVAEEHGLEPVDLTDAFVDPVTGRFSRELDGEVVRATDGIHLCEPEEPEPTTCPADAPGVVRFADPIAAAAVEAARRTK